jgi:hypothetical protein
VLLGRWPLVRGLLEPVGAWSLAGGWLLAGR